MSKRSRILGFGAALGLIVLGAIFAVAFSSVIGDVLALVLIALGLILATSLVFLEVGLSEDHERDREGQAAAERQRGVNRARPRTRLRRPRAIERSRGHRRRLR